MQNIHKRRLFIASCIALIVTAMSFAIRANIMTDLGDAFGLNAKQVGEVTAAAFWGFTLSMFIGGPLCDFIGLRNLFLIAFFSHVIGIFWTVFSTGYGSLFLSTLLIGIGNGLVESASYSLVSSMYTGEKIKKINDWHIWFPAGIVIGGLVGYFLALFQFGWKAQVLTMAPVALVYGLLFAGQTFPKSERITLGITNKEMIKACFNPLFLFMVFCMLLTSSIELGTNQWIVALLSSVGVPSILLLVFIYGLMALGRSNAGFLLKRISTTGLLVFSSVFSLAGLLWLSVSEGYSSFAAAGVFAIGICFFWPTMIGFVSENLPKTGPLGLSIMGGVGMLSVSLIMPYLGQIYDYQLHHALAGHSLDALKSAATGSGEALLWDQVQYFAGAHTLRMVAILPAILLIAFTALHFRRKQRQLVLAH